LRNLFVLMFLLTYTASAQIDEEPRLVRFFKQFYSKPGHIQNETYLSSHYGLTFPSFGFDQFDTDLANTFNLEFSYGFVRLIEDKNFEDLFKHQSEYLFIGNISTNFKTFNIQSDGVVSDTWRFGFGLNDGYGYNFGKNSNFWLMHNSAITWTRTDFVDRLSLTFDDSLLNTFDENFKFGGMWSAGVRMQIYKSLNVDLIYEHSLYYKYFLPAEWVGMWFFDNVTQRFIEIWEPELFEQFGRNYPWMKFAYKNLLSLLMYELRRKQAFYPFNGEGTFNFDSFKIAISLKL
jgi:hypothetical protein